MDRELFALGIAELKLFFKGFSPSTNQVEAWYDRLKFFEDDAWRLAVYELTESESAAPSFKLIKQGCFKAKGRVKAPRNQKEPIEGGSADHTNEKYDLSAMYMGLLHKAMRIQDQAEREKQFKELKEEWVSDYRKLPGYKTEAQRRRDRANEPLEENQLYIPKFTGEKLGKDINLSNQPDGFWG